MAPPATMMCLLPAVILPTLPGGARGSDSKVPIDAAVDVTVSSCEPPFGSYGTAVGFAEEIWRQLGRPDSCLINCGVEQ